ncbi:MAG: ROK family protein [Candidatus Dormibacteraeota bacterium]|uniref:ROK family protein n=1 Tax=Candidatus Aeolococcus gillhamiae TaxID=3127015 RepID=A0A934N9C5_9BACT|nr:ROK family protein [Candidatus Dormibacteraeota bacterium]
MSTLIGVDLGGTNIRAAVATGTYTHAAPTHSATPGQDGPAAVVEAIARCVAEAAGGRQVDGLAIGIPGPLDPRRGIVYAAPQLRGWDNFEAASALRSRIGCEVVIHNDANLAGYAEWVAGAGRGTTDFIFITASTGVGGALIISGDLYAGKSGTAGEIGHMPLSPDQPPCGEGHPGCLEGTASGTAIARSARRAVEAGEFTSLSELAPDAIDGRAVQDAAHAGDEVALRIFTTAARSLGRAVGGLINLFSPEAIAIGGGLINAGELLFGPLRAAVGEMAFAVPAEQCRIVEAELGTDAGLVGAVAWAVKSFGQSSPAGNG